MAVRIITDSSCEHPFSRRQEWNIDILPFRLFFGEEEYIDGETMTRDQFYSKLVTAQELPKTAQITPLEYADVFRPYIEAGDEILLMPISRELSGTHNSALLAKEEFPGAPIYIVDTQNVTFALALMVDLAVRFRDEGCSAREIWERLEAIRPRVRLYALVNDLKYLRMGGRLSSAGAVVGTLLGIKPVITLREGRVVANDKARGLSAAVQTVLRWVQRDGVDASYPVYFGNSDFPEGLAEFRGEAETRLTLGERYAVDIGPIVGTHVGPGAVGMAFVAKE